MLNKWCKLAIIILLPLEEVIKHNYCGNNEIDNSYSSYYKFSKYAFRKTKTKLPTSFRKKANVSRNIFLILN